MASYSTCCRGGLKIGKQRCGIIVTIFWGAHVLDGWPTMDRRVTSPPRERNQPFATADNAGPLTITNLRGTSELPADICAPPPQRQPKGEQRWFACPSFRLSDVSFLALLNKRGRVVRFPCRHSQVANAFSDRRTCSWRNHPAVKGLVFAAI